MIRQNLISSRKVAIFFTAALFCSMSSFKNRNMVFVFDTLHCELQCVTTASALINYVSSGDNNRGDDRVLYAHGQLWLQRQHIIGWAVG